jgi:hypothetical protein
LRLKVQNNLPNVVIEKMSADLVARVRRAIVDPDEPETDLPHLRYATSTSYAAHRKHEEDDDEDDDEDDEYTKRTELPWPARNREGKINKIAKAFQSG